jgi:hypothetical protein
VALEEANKAQSKVSAQDKAAYLLPADLSQRLVVKLLEVIRPAEDSPSSPHVNVVARQIALELIALVSQFQDAQSILTTVNDTIVVCQKISDTSIQTQVLDHSKIQ